MLADRSAAHLKGRCRRGPQGRASGVTVLCRVRSLVRFRRMQISSIIAGGFIIFSTATQDSARSGPMGHGKRLRTTPNERVGRSSLLLSTHLLLWECGRSQGTLQLGYTLNGSLHRRTRPLHAEPQEAEATPKEHTSGL